MSTWANCYKLVQGFRVTCYSLVSTILKVMTWLQMLYSCWSDQPLVGWIKVLLQPSYWDQTNTIKCINVFLGSNHVKINVIINLLIKPSLQSSFTLFTIFCIFICCVFWPAFGCCAHPRNIFSAVFQPFFVHFKAFSLISRLKSTKTSEN